MHYDDTPPYYTIRLGGTERSTVRERLQPVGLEESEAEVQAVEAVKGKEVEGAAKATAAVDAAATEAKAAKAAAEVEANVVAAKAGEAKAAKAAAEVEANVVAAKAGEAKAAVAKAQRAAARAEQLVKSIAPASANQPTAHPLPYRN